MKKIISQWKWDKLFDETELGLGHHLENGNWELDDDELEEWFKRLDDLEHKYIVIGPRVFCNFIRDNFHKLFDIIIDDRDED